MGESGEQIPEFVEEKIQDMANTKNYDVNELKKEYIEILNDGSIDKINFSTDDEKYDFAFRFLKSRVIDSLPTVETTIIPIGCTDVNVTKEKGIRISNLYAIVSKPKLHIQSFPCWDKQASIVYNIQYFSRYKVKLGQRDDDTLAIIDRTKFENPEPVLNNFSSKNVEKLLVKKVGIRRITIEETPHKKSRIVTRDTRNGKIQVPDETDWRVIRGFIQRGQVIRKTGDDGVERVFGVYNIFDDTTDIEETTLHDGTIIPKTMTVWTPSIFVNYEGECDFYGSVRIDQQSKEPQMNACLVVPTDRAIPKE